MAVVRVLYTRCGKCGSNLNVDKFNREYCPKCLDVEASATDRFIKKETKETNTLPTIIIPHSSRTDYLQLCLNSIPKEFDVYVIRGGTFAQNCNKGFQLAKNKESVIFLNDDVILNPKIIKELVEMGKKYDIVGCPTYLPEFKMILEGIEFTNLHKDPISFKINYPRYPFVATINKENVTYPSGAIFAIKSRVFEELGGFCEDYINGGEDVELFLKALESKKRICYTTATAVHFLSKSPHRMDFNEQNHKLLLSRFSEERLKNIFCQGNGKISVIIPTIDGELDKATAVEAYFRERFPDLVQTVIIIDSEKKGACWARNEGLSRTDGEFVLFCDNDIRWEEGAIRRMFETLMSDPSLSFVYGDYRRHNYPVGTSSVVNTLNFDIDKLKQFNYISTMAMVRRCDITTKWDESIKRFQDWDFFLTMVEQGKLGQKITGVLFTAHYNPEHSITLNENAAYWRKYIEDKHKI